MLGMPIRTGSRGVDEAESCDGSVVVDVDGDHDGSVLGKFGVIRRCLAVFQCNIDRINLCVSLLWCGQDDLVAAFSAV